MIGGSLEVRSILNIDIETEKKAALTRQKLLHSNRDLLLKQIYLYNRSNGLRNYQKLSVAGDNLSAANLAALPIQSRAPQKVEGTQARSLSLR